MLCVCADSFVRGDSSLMLISIVFNLSIRGPPLTVRCVCLDSVPPPLPFFIPRPQPQCFLIPSAPTVMPTAIPIAPTGQCASGTVLDPTSNTCIAACPAGSTLDPASGACLVLTQQQLGATAATAPACALGFTASTTQANMCVSNPAVETVNGCKCNQMWGEQALNVAWDMEISEKVIPTDEKRAARRRTGN